MTLKHYSILFLISFALIYGVAQFEKTPGYMDAEYYYSGAMQLARGAGFQEPFLWNYLDRPSGLPHPSHTYWMPMASLLAAIFPSLVGKVTLDLARIPLILIASLISPITALFANRLGSDKANAWFAGLLALFPGFYLAYLPTTDTFAIYMVVGTGFILVGSGLFSEERSARRWVRAAGLGALAGGMHLTRADGIVWLFFGFFLIIFSVWQKRSAHQDQRDSPNHWVIALLELGVTVVGYGSIMGLWYSRNLTIYGSLMTSGNSYSLWMENYNQLFIYPVDRLSFQSWWGQGIATIVAVRWDALLANLMSFLGVQNSVVLAPFVFVGAWKYRRNPIVWIGLLGWTATLLIMSIVFPFAGARGGFFHSGAAWQPFLWALVPAGLKAIVYGWGDFRKWTKTAQALKVFQTSLVVLVFLISGALTYQRVIGADPSQPVWEESATYYRQIGDVLDNLGIKTDQLIMVNNPPGFFCATGRPSIVVPDGDLEIALQAASQYRADYLLIEKNHPAGLDNYYEDPQPDPRLEFVQVTNQASLYRIVR